MTAALPLLGALVSTIKAVKNSKVMVGKPALRAEAAFLCSLLSEHVFQLLEGRLVQIQNNLPQQQQEQEKHEELMLEACEALLGTGLQLYAWTVGSVYAFAALAAEISLQCIKNQQLGEVLVEATPPFLSSSLQQMLQQARSTCSASKEMGAETEAAKAGGEDGIEAAQYGCGEKAATAPAAAEVVESLAASRLYAEFLRVFKGQNLLKLVYVSSATPYLDEMEELLDPRLLFLDHRAELWEQVMADTEEGIDQPGKLIGCVLRAAAALQAVCKHLPEQFLGEEYLIKLVDVLHSNEDLFKTASAEMVTGLQQPTSTPYCAKTTAKALFVLQPFVAHLSAQYVMLLKLSFCCGDPACLNVRGRSELELVMGPGKRGGGYCSGCKRVWYCSEACQRGCWEEHSKVCKEVGRGARKAASSKGIAGSTSGSRQ
jgi:hypothetical protein